MIKANIFLSYSREDLTTASDVYNALVEKGCNVWMDRKELLVGDDFVRTLSEQLKRCDALVFLLTPSSAKSSWCLAELQRALADGLVIVIIEAVTNTRLPDALERMLRDIQRSSWPEIDTSIGIQIRRARVRRFQHHLKISVFVIGFVTLLAIAALFSASRINSLEITRYTEEFIEQLVSAEIAWSGSEIRTRLKPLQNNPELENSLRAIAEDTAKKPMARINAWQAKNALQEGRQREWRTFVPQIDWKGGRLADALWLNTSYGTGVISDLLAERVRMAGIIFGNAPAADKKGLTIAGASIREADIWFLRIDGTQMIDVEFVNSKFRGAQLDLTGAGGVRFRSDIKNQVFSGTEVTIIEDSWIVQNNRPAANGVIDLGTPEKELLFDGVQFVRVRFEGNFKSEWFKSSSFTDCIFATGLNASDLEKNGNSHERSIFLAR